MISPSFFWFSTSVVSSVSSKTRLRCWSKPFSLPLRLLPPFKRTRTILPRFCSRISVVISLIWNPQVSLSSLYFISQHLNLSQSLQETDSVGGYLPDHANVWFFSAIFQRQID